MTADQVIDKASFHSWVRFNVPNGKNWRECNPTQYIIDCHRRVYGDR